VCVCVCVCVVIYTYIYLHTHTDGDVGQVGAARELRMVRNEHVALGYE